MQLKYFPFVGHTLCELLLNFINEKINGIFGGFLTLLYSLLYVLRNSALGLQFSRTIDEMFLGHLKPLKCRSDKG